LNSNKQVEGSYAQVVKTAIHQEKRKDSQRIVLSYEAQQEDMLRLQHAFIGVVNQPGMSYNKQNVFHTQGVLRSKSHTIGFQFDDA
jgi:hypothetical protein